MGDLDLVCAGPQGSDRVDQALDLIAARRGPRVGAVQAIGLVVDDERAAARFTGEHVGAPVTIV